MRRTARRVVIKAEVVPPRRPFCGSPRFIYEKVYCARGDIENRIKELLDGLQIDRTVHSLLGEPVARLADCRGVRAHAGAAAAGGAYRLRPHPGERLRDRRWLGVHVVRSARRLVLHLPRASRSTRGGISPSSSGRRPDSPPRRRNRLLAEGQKPSPG